MYITGKRKVVVTLKEEITKKKRNTLDDLLVEQMLEREIQEEHIEILKKRENELMVEKICITNELNKATAELNELKTILNRESEIPKTK